jgi:hypothetical protein
VPTFDQTARFRRDLASLTNDQRHRFKLAVEYLVEDLTAGRRPRGVLRVKGVAGAPGVLEMSWAPNGRATFQYGREVRPGEPHVIWRRVGTHDIFREP